MDEERLNTILEDISKRSHLSKEEVLSLVQRKKLQVGSGYLTSIGAAYLVASDLGVDVSDIGRKVYKLRELIPNLVSVTIFCYLLNLGQSRSYVNKKGQTSYYARALIFDEAIIMRCLIWDVIKIQFLSSIERGTALLLDNVSTKIGKDGKLEVHVGTKSDISIMEKTPKEIDSIICELRSLKEQQKEIVLKGVVSILPREITFTKKDGTVGNAIQFNISDVDDPTINNRVVIWSPQTSIKPTINLDHEVILIDVETRVGKGNNIEIHGNQDTVTIEGPKINKTGHGIPPNSFVILSIGPPIEGHTRQTALLTDGTVTVTLSLSREFRSIFDTLTIGDIIQINDYTIKEKRLIIPNPINELRIIGSNESFLTRYIKRIKDINANEGPCILEVVCLSKASSKLISTKSGNVKKTNVTVGDDSGEAELFGWQEQGERLSNLLPGTRLMLYAVQPSISLEGTRRLQVKEYTTINIIRE